MHEALAALAHDYNTSVLGLRLGTDLTVIVFGQELVKQVFSSEEYDGRPDSFFTRLRGMGQRKGITFTDGRFWQEQRSFAVRHLRQVGFGKELMEGKIMDELHELLHLFGESSAVGRDVSMGVTFAPSVLNVLWVLTTGDKFSSRDDPNLHRLQQLFTARAKAFDLTGGSLNQFPWMRFLAPERIGYNVILRLNADLKDMFMMSIKQHQKSYDSDTTNDLIDAFLHEMEARKGDKTSTFTGKYASHLEII
ncbi:putative cytochrome P450 305a1 [Zootermopsis nevadensis]|uniref:Putative cytochrome P450 305a1 n=1 Tax=Zootermopsis nevadensis TaxID=136037 RepID=A0A067QT24_ZOONE|nr:putative cytochrome P450 305a1 [Zootermopsis nevadensis]